MWPKWFVDGQWDFYDHLVGRRARELPEEDALLWEGDDGAVRRLSWREADDEARRLASVLQGLGVEQGDRIGVFLPMLPETALVMLATVRLGAIAMPFFSGYGAEAVANRLNDGEAKVLVCADGFFRRGKAVPMLEEARAPWRDPLRCGTCSSSAGSVLRGERLRRERIGRNTTTPLFLPQARGTRNLPFSPPRRRR